jgi:hypothetical protein
MVTNGVPTVACDPAIDVVSILLAQLDADYAVTIASESNLERYIGYESFECSSESDDSSDFFKNESILHPLDSNCNSNIVEVSSSLPPIAQEEWKASFPRNFSDEESSALKLELSSICRSWNGPAWQRGLTDDEFLRLVSRKLGSSNTAWK